MTFKFVKKLREFIGDGAPDSIDGRRVALIGDDELPIGSEITDTGTGHDLSIRYPMAPSLPNYQAADFISQPLCKALAPKLNMDPMKLMAFCASNFYLGGYARLEQELSRMMTGQQMGPGLEDMVGQDGHIQDHIVGHEERTIYNQ